MEEDARNEIVKNEYDEQIELHQLRQNDAVEEDRPGQILDIDYYKPFQRNTLYSTAIKAPRTATRRVRDDAARACIKGQRANGAA